LGRYPNNVLGGVLDIACFAVYAVLRIDLQAWVSAIAVAHDFIDACGAITLFGRVILREIHLDRNFGIREPKVTGLIFLMVRIGQKH
jgi:hypothetical protein